MRPPLMLENSEFWVMLRNSLDLHYNSGMWICSDIKLQIIQMSGVKSKIEFHIAQTEQKVLWHDWWVAMRSYLSEWLFI
jgi:hypothetical protein